jgi:hypothetical protein
MTFRMEARELVKPDLIAGMLPAEDAATLATVMAPLKEAEGFGARGCGAYWSGSVGLIRLVSRVALERHYGKSELNPASGEASSVGWEPCACATKTELSTSRMRTIWTTCDDPTVCALFEMQRRSLASHQHLVEMRQMEVLGTSAIQTAGGQTIATLRGPTRTPCT